MRTFDFDSVSHLSAGSHIYPLSDCNAIISDDVTRSRLAQKHPTAVSRGAINSPQQRQRCWIGALDPKDLVHNQCDHGKDTGGYHRHKECSRPSTYFYHLVAGVIRLPLEHQSGWLCDLRHHPAVRGLHLGQSPHLWIGDPRPKPHQRTSHDRAQMKF